MTGVTARQTDHKKLKILYQVKKHPPQVIVVSASGNLPARKTLYFIKQNNTASQAKVRSGPLSSPRDSYPQELFPQGLANTPIGDSCSRELGLLETQS